MTAQALLHPLDEARRRWLQVLGPLGRRLVRDRALRVRVGGLLAVAFALSAALAAPVLLLALSPILLGLPHLVSDVRYLVVRPGLHRRRGLVLAAGVPLAIAIAGWPLEGALVASIGAVVVARAPLGRRFALGAAIAAAGAFALGFGWTAALALAHAHNAIALVLWWRLRPRSAADLLFPVAWVAALVVIAAGAADGSLARFDLVGWSAATRLSRLAPGLPAPWDERLVVSFAFAQSVHYGVWVRLVPDDARGRATPRSFAATWRALASDFGGAAIASTGLAAIGLAIYALFDLAGANEAYLRVALFHGPMELAVLALATAERT